MASTVGATVLAAKATPKAMELIADEEWNRHELLTPTEKARLTWKCYIPAGIMAALSLLCTAGGTKVSLNRQAELMSIAAAGERMLERYTRKVQETIGEEAEKKIRHDLAVEEVSSRTAVSHEDPGTLIMPTDFGVYETGYGDELILEAWTGRMIRSSERALKNQCAEYNVHCSSMLGTFSPINEFYDMANMPCPIGGNAQGYSNEYRMGDVEFTWDSDRHVYKIMTYLNNPKSEFGLAH